MRMLVPALLYNFQGFPQLRWFLDMRKTAFVKIALEIYLVLRLRAEDDVLCFEF